MFNFLLFLALLPIFISHGYEIQPRIVNGVKSDTSKYPFYVRLLNVYKKGNDDSASKCGASLLNDRWIVTAAHCVDGMTEIYASFGINSAGEFVIDQQLIEQVNIHKNPNYIYKAATGNDIALLKLSTPLELNEKIQPIKLPSDCGEDVFNDVITTIVGTGLTGMFSSDGILRETKLITFPSEECGKDKSYICLNSTVFASTPHSGDSGSPLIRESDNALIGIFSFSRFNPFSSSRFEVSCLGTTNIHYYFDWISKITGIDLPKCNISLK